MILGNGLTLIKQDLSYLAISTFHCYPFPINRNEVIRQLANNEARF